MEYACHYLEDGEAVDKAKAYLRNHQAVPGVELWLGDPADKITQTDNNRSLARNKP